MAEVQMTGYHGTIKVYADTILSQQHFNPSEDSNEWLGKGVYFYGHYEEAQWWAKNQVRRRGGEAAVLQAILAYSDTAFLDLDVFSSAQAVNRTFNKFLQDLAAAGEVIPNFSGRDDLRHCYAIELYKRKHPEVKIISYTFDAPTGSYNKAEFAFVPRQKQYCVIDHSIIQSISLSDSPSYSIKKEILL